MQTCRNCGYEDCPSDNLGYCPYPEGRAADQMKKLAEDLQSGKKRVKRVYIQGE